MKKALIILICLFTITVTGLVAHMTRYELIEGTYSARPCVYKLDRWTGEVILISGVEELNVN